FQAEELHFLLEDFKQRLDWAIYLKVDAQTMQARSTARSRSDDTPAVWQQRLKSFEERTLPILEYYGSRGVLLTVNAQTTAGQVTTEILQKLKS
ncbi:MAG: nucleoside monophosphate kinase, partial [Spirulinaceae cyanobacterium]